MNVPKRIVAVLAASILSTVAAIYFLPGIDLIQYVVPIMQAGFVSTLLLAAVSFYREKDLNMKDKNLLMNGFIIAVLVPSFYAAGAFVHQSQTSWSGGEIHWHADFEVIVGNGEYQQLNLIDPGKFCEETSHESTTMCTLNDRTGSTKYHEHNDDRIHLEGIFKDREDATLAAFFDTFNGELSDSRIVFPTNNRTVKLVEGDQKTLKVLVHKGVGGNRAWCAIEKPENIDEEDICVNSNGELATEPSEYVISPYKRGASLDDIIIVYDSKTVTDALQDVRQDDLYEGMGLTKGGEGF